MTQYKGSGITAGVVFVFFVILAIAVGAAFWAIRDMAADRDATARAEAQAEVSKTQIAADLEQAIAEANAAAEAAKSAAATDQERIRWQYQTEQQVNQLTHELALLREHQAEYEKRITILAIALEALNESDQERLFSLLEQPAEPAQTWPALVTYLSLAGGAIIALLLAFAAVLALFRRWAWKGGPAKL